MTTAPFHSVFEDLQDLYYLLRVSEREAACDSGLNLTDYHALSVLVQFGEMTAGRLAQHLGATAATTTALVNRLELSGYVSRHRDASDRRHVRISATPTSFLKILGPIRSLAAAIDDHLQSLPVDQAVLATNFLNTAKHLMREHLPTASQKDTP